MINVEYNRLFKIETTHSFYADGLSKTDLSILPTAATKITLQNLKLVFRSYQGAIEVFYRFDGSGPFLPISNVNLVFGVDLVNKNGFLNFTDLSDTLGGIDYESGKIIHLSNKGQTTTKNLKYSLIDLLRPSVFSYDFDAAGSTGHIKIFNADDTDVTPAYPDPDTLSPYATGKFTYPVDLSMFPPGLYKFETWGSGAHTIKTIYISNELSQKNIFGVIEIVATAGSFPASQLYATEFVRRAVRRQYVVVLNSGQFEITDDINIIDQDFSAPVTPYPALTFSLDGTTTVNGKDAFVFLSDSSVIPFFEIPKTRLDIVKDPLTTPVSILKNIKGPPLDTVSSDNGNFSVSQIFLSI